MRERQFLVRLEPSGWSFPAAADESLMEAARASGIALPASCRNGTCRTCICRLQSGAIRHRIDWPGLSAEEKRDGYILPCVACAQSDAVIAVPGAKKMPTA